jgi:hypothetical protein
MGARKSTTARRAGRRTSASVSDRACTCHFLERAAAEPTSSIVFDERTNEYHIVGRGAGRHGHLVVYHCPFCGGAAPKSKRSSLFAHITHAEAGRLNNLAAGMRTVREAIAKLGKPDDDMPAGLRSGRAGSTTEPPTLTSYRTLRYERLSKTVDVLLVDEGPARGLRVTLQGKHVGAPRKP